MRVLGRGGQPDAVTGTRGEGDDAGERKATQGRGKAVHRVCPDSWYGMTNAMQAVRLTPERPAPTENESKKKPPVGAGGDLGISLLVPVPGMLFLVVG
jgi:hypothetical protein